MSPTDYIIDLLLIGLVLRQIRRRPLTTRPIVLPFVLIAVAGLELSATLPDRGNDLALIVLLAAVGTTLGALSGLTTRVWREDGAIMSQAGAVAALLWVLGMAAALALLTTARTVAARRLRGSPFRMASRAPRRGRLPWYSWHSARCWREYWFCRPGGSGNLSRAARPRSLAATPFPIKHASTNWRDDGTSAALKQPGERFCEPLLVRIGSPTPASELVVHACAGQHKDQVYEPLERRAPTTSRGPHHAAYELEPAVFDVGTRALQVGIGLRRLGKHLEQPPGSDVDSPEGSRERSGPFGVAGIGSERVAEQCALELRPGGSRPANRLAQGGHQQGRLRPNREVNSLRSDAGALSDPGECRPGPTRLREALACRRDDPAPGSSSLLRAYG